MAASKCFNTIQPSQTSSDYLNQLRQTTIFNVTNKAVINNTFGGYKKNTFKISTNPNNNNNSGCLIWADSYESLIDVNKGKTIVKNEINTNLDEYNAPFYTISSGNAYDRTIVEDTNYEYQYDDTCFYNAEEGHVPPYMNSVKIVPTTIPAIQNYIKSINQKQLFHNSRTPRSIGFGNICP